jgi:hypothetical protein
VSLGYSCRFPIYLAYFAFVEGAFTQENRSDQLRMYAKYRQSVIALGEGRTLAATGFTETLGSLHNQTLETYNPITKALLLPDGRVVAAGGNPDATQLVEWDKVTSKRRYRSVRSLARISHFASH